MPLTKLSAIPLNAIGETMSKAQNETFAAGWRTLVRTFDKRCMVVRIPEST